MTLQNDLRTREEVERDIAKCESMLLFHRTLIEDSQREMELTQQDLTAARERQYVLDHEYQRHGADK